MVPSGWWQPGWGFGQGCLEDTKLWGAGHPVDISRYLKRHVNF